jgi:formylglycine-generating enzyme required for sulfatase activity
MNTKTSVFLQNIHERRLVTTPPTQVTKWWSACRARMASGALLVAGMILVSALANADEQEKETRNLDLLKRFHSEWVELKPGTFKMGNAKSNSESPVQTVKIAYVLRVAKYEVPQNLYEAVMGENPSLWKGPRNSVEMTSFDDAMAFCRKATLSMRSARLIGKDQIVRLPTEAEWEFFARAGTQTRFSFGDSEADLDDYGWSTGNAAGNDPPVGAKKPNPWGLYDVHGYLWEWCLDPGNEDHQGAPNNGSVRPKGDKDMRVLRGGSWKDQAELLTSSARSGPLPHKDANGTRIIRLNGGAPRELKDDAVGFRCVLAPIEKAYGAQVE